MKYFCLSWNYICKLSTIQNTFSHKELNIDRYPIYLSATRKTNCFSVGKTIVYNGMLDPKTSFSNYCHNMTEKRELIGYSLLWRRVSATASQFADSLTFFNNLFRITTATTHRQRSSNSWWKRFHVMSSSCMLWQHESLRISKFVCYVRLVTGVYELTMRQGDKKRQMKRAWLSKYIYYHVFSLFA